jgi:hypothetical protein
MVEESEGSGHGPEGLEGSTVAVIVFGIVVVIILAAVGVILVQELVSTGDEYEFSESIYEERPADSNTILSASTVNGYIDVQSWDQNLINISALKYADNGEYLEKLDLEIAVNGDEIDIEVKHETAGLKHAGINLDVKIPYGAAIETLSSVNGRIKVVDISIVKNVGTVNGAVHLEGVGVIHEVNTTNGAISVEILTMNNHVELLSENGEIEVHIMTSLDASVDIMTSNGHISIHDVPLDLVVDEPHHKAGDLGSGGKQLSIHTLNGDIGLHDLA